MTATGNGATKTITIAGGSSGLSNVVEDTTPELGGTLEADGYNVEFTDSSAATDGRAKFGTGDDLQIYHNGSRSYIQNTGGPLEIHQSSGSDIVFKNLKASPSTSLTDYLRCERSTGQVNLYHYGLEKLETKSTGIQVNGTITLTDGIGNTTYSFPTADGSANQVLQTNGSGTLSFATVSGSGLSNVVDDTSPQLGGDLDANGNNIKIDGGNKLLFQGDTTTTNNFLEYNTHYSQSQLLTDSNFTISVGGSNQFSVGSGGVGNPSFLSSIIADP